jgi:hypothetical protein
VLWIPIKIAWRDSAHYFFPSPPFTTILLNLYISNLSGQTLDNFKIKLMDNMPHIPRDNNDQAPYNVLTVMEK